MALDWSDAAQAQLAGGNLRPVFFVLFDTSPKIRICTTIGDFPLEADSIDTTGGTYLGFGELQGLPAFEQLINGQASRLEIGLAGTAVSRDVARLASEDAETIRNAGFHIGFAALGADLQIASPVAWVWHGEAATVTCSRDDSQDQPIRSISASIGSLFTRRRRPGVSFWTDHDQRERSSSDAFCDRVAAYSAGTTKTWPM
jgi:hypothetical protein